MLLVFDCVGGLLGRSRSGRHWVALNSHPLLEMLGELPDLHCLMGNRKVVPKSLEYKNKKPKSMV
jgi:hypothetical protein